MAKTVEIIPVVHFTGYPDGVKVEFRKGEPAKVPAKWVADANLADKGLIETGDREA